MPARRPAWVTCIGKMLLGKTGGNLTQTTVEQHTNNFWLSYVGEIWEVTMIKCIENRPELAKQPLSRRQNTFEAEGVHESVPLTRKHPQTDCES